MTKKNYKDYIYIALFVITILGYGTRFVLMADQVKRNEIQVEMVTKKFEEADIKLLNYRLGQIEEKLDKIVTYMLEE